jgi:hypothetical protein
MEYFREVIDRASGELATVSLGEWITVTELGRRYGVGRLKVRLILHHMGFLAREGRSFRLPWHHVEKGYGKRHEATRKRRAFDVISPLGQQLIDEAWADTVEDYESDLCSEAGIDQAKDALAKFKLTRLPGQQLDTVMQIHWLLDFFPQLTDVAVADIIDCDRSFASRTRKARRRQKAFWSDHKRKNGEPQPEELTQLAA